MAANVQDSPLMRGSFRRYTRWFIAWASLVALGGWLLPPLVNVERYRRRLKSELEQELGRPVDFGAVSVRLLPRPGFSIQNAAIGEAPGFGDEPFARIERIECDVRWRSLWQSRLSFDRLRLEHASFNLVRRPEGGWNLASLIGREAPARGGTAAGSPPADAGGPLRLESEGARLDFKIGADKKPFAVTNVAARLDLDFTRGNVNFRLAGEPIRTDMSLPTPGRVELEGEWTPGEKLSGPLAATLRTEGALLYDWIPLLTGRNPDLYGVLDLQADLRGSIYSFQFEGRGTLRQLHRSELPPPADAMPATLYARGQFDAREGGRVVVESADASFRDLILQSSGIVEQVFSAPQMDLVVAVEHSRLEDFFQLARRFASGAGAAGLSGRLDGLVTVRGPWREPRLGGFFKAQQPRLIAGGTTFPMSDLDLRVNETGIRLAPVRVMVAPRVELVAEAVFRPPAPPTMRSKQISAPSPPSAGEPHAFGLRGLQYDLALSAKAVPVSDLVRFSRSLGIRAAREVDAQGIATASFGLTGKVWPITPPAWHGQAELRGTRLFLPGLTEPLHLPHARLEISENRIVVDPVTAVIGTSVFTGRLEHQGGRSVPWTFNAHTSQLSLEQSALWFDVLGHRPPLPLLARIPGIRSLLEQRTAASSLFAGLNASGRFSVATLTYHSVTLTNVVASAAVSGRTVQLGVESFRAGGGRGAGDIRVDLTASPPRVVVDARLSGAAIAPLALRLPPELGKMRGSYSAAGHFEMRGLTAGEISSSIHGQAFLRMRNVSFGGFDPVAALARAQGRAPDPTRPDTMLRSASFVLSVEDRRVTLAESPVLIGGTELRVGGVYEFGGTADLSIATDARRVWDSERSRTAASRGAQSAGEPPPSPEVPPFHLQGPLNRLAPVRPEQASRQAP